MEAYITDIDAMLDQMEEQEKEDSPVSPHLSDFESAASTVHPVERPHSLFVQPEFLSSFPDSGLGSSQELGPASMGSDTTELIMIGLHLHSPSESLTTVREAVDAHFTPSTSAFPTSFMDDYSDSVLPPETPLNMEPDEQKDVSYTPVISFVRDDPALDSEQTPHVIPTPVSLVQEAAEKSEPILVDESQPVHKHHRDEKIQLRSGSTIEEVSSRPAVGFDKKSWNTTEDVSDSELDQFLKTLDSSPPVTPRDDYSNREAGSSSPVHFEEPSLLLESQDADPIRMSPPLELAPPVPMTLIDVSEFDDLELSLPFSERSLSEELARDFISVEGAGSIPVVEAASAGDEILIPTIESSIISSVTEDDSSVSPAETASSSMMEESMVSATESLANDENDAPQNPSTSSSEAPVIFSADNLGKVKPEWVPDEFAPICMLCGLRFTLVKRRHHCRACGSVICASCGNYRAKLEYMDNKEDRICALCNETFLFKSGQNAPMDTGPPGDEPTPSVSVSTSAPLPVPPGVLRRQDRPPRNSLEPRSVVFFDGIRPGGDLSEHEAQGNARRLALMNAKRQRRSPAPPLPKGKSPPKRSSANHVVRLFINREILPVMELTSDGHNVLHEHPDLPTLLLKFTMCPSENVDFFVNSCLKVSVQILDLKCCMGHVVWSYSTSGMRLVGQDEICILLEKQDMDVLPPRDVFLHLNEIFLHAKQGNVIGNLGHSIVGLSGYESGFLGSRNNAGFLFIRPSFQCLASLRLPEPPYLFGVLMTKWEVPWAKLFPLRLMLRLGAQYRYYPCPLVSFRDRKAVYEEIGHTVMNLLCDFRNFQYHLPCMEDTESCMEKGLITVRFPRHRYDQIIKACQTSNEHVLPIGLDFSKRADAHLVCIQNLENGQYETQAINIQSKGRQVTGTSFIIFNGSLKSMDHTECRASVVEDGIMVQITFRGLDELKVSLKAMKTIVFKAQSSTPEGSTNQDALVIEWTDEQKSCNLGVRSPIDGKDLSGVDSRRVSLKHSVDFLNGTLCVRCTEVFLTDEKDYSVTYREDVDLSRLAENLAMVTCSIIRAHLYDYRDNGWTKVGLRVVLGPDIMEYDIGAKEERFGQDALMEFDEKIMRLVNECARSWGSRPRLEMELLFRIFQH
ncbi:zinc finger FYVE domain-containing protein 9-like isoform X2 [Paramacrobiotus metropolitanus]|uniref:zinc finger FYVE domain-containing protein 9-like isoform X2 n=1 Tax=Paramacrobiotus metropolitanus TaxID=2943436 RepID=UPI002445A319|nr:zinc finger FYVE domain-containing protein 9-like isoform X2 [Paramacrobiotus metropolitanus]